MNRALFAAASGMAAQQTNLDLIANNLANADIPGFKGAAAAFAEISAPGGAGLGTATLGSYTIFEQGKLMKSGGPFDIAIDGPGFFEVNGPHGQRAYTRDGAFSRDSDGALVNAHGFHLAGVRIPADATQVDAAQDGTVIAQTPSGKRGCGRIRIAAFAASERLASAGGTVFTPTPASGPPLATRAGTQDGPKVRFGMLEQSNVSIVESMMQILEAQRAYEANAKGVQAADEMLRIANNLQRG